MHGRRMNDVPVGNWKYTLRSKARDKEAQEVSLSLQGHLTPETKMLSEKCRSIWQEIGIKSSSMAFDVPRFSDS